jgi:hypothetical protein
MTWREKYRRDPDLAESIITTLRNDLHEALAEFERLRKNTRPEPSRLEIAAGIMQGWAAAPVVDLRHLEIAALRHADALIAAAKEAQP